MFKVGLTTVGLLALATTQFCYANEMRDTAKVVTAVDNKSVRFWWPERVALDKLHKFKHFVPESS